MASVMFFARKELAYLFSPLDDSVRELLCESILPVIIFYFLSAVQYGKPSRYRCHLGCVLLKTAAISLRTGLWAVLEGQMRIMATGKRDRLRTTTS